MAAYPGYEMQLYLIPPWTAAVSYSNETSIFDLAASYSYGLAKNHPFIDANKRDALTVATLFLELNGYSLDATEPETVVIFDQLAAGHLSEENLSIWFKDSSISTG